MFVNPFLNCIPILAAKLIHPLLICIEVVCLILVTLLEYLVGGMPIFTDSYEVINIEVYGWDMDAVQ